MKKIFTCRRTVLSIFAICCLTLLGYTKGADVAATIGTIVLAVSASNATQGIMEKRNER